MSVQAMSWAMKQQIVTNPAARHVLLCLANYANDGGDAAFPSVNTLTTITGLSRRTIYNKLDELESLGVIKPGNPKIVAAYIENQTKRPVCYDICIWLPLEPENRGAADAPQGNPGCSRCTPGVQEVHNRGAGGAPNPSFNPSLDPVIDTQGHSGDEPEPETVEQASKRFHASPINRKGGKQSDKAFEAAWKRSGMGLTEFTDMLIDDVNKRIEAQQFGFAGLHSTTYLRNDRWTDEIKQADSGQHAAKPGTFDGAMRAIDEWEQRQQQGGESLAHDDADLRGKLDTPVRHGTVQTVDDDDSGFI